MCSTVHLVLRVHVFRQSHSTCTRVLAALTAGPAPAAGCAGQRLERNPGSFRTVALLDGCPFVLACWKVLLHLLACLPHHSRIRLVNQCRMQGSQHVRLKRTDPLQMIHEHEGLHEGLANISAHACIWRHDDCASSKYTSVRDVGCHVVAGGDNVLWLHARPHLLFLFSRRDEEV